MPARSRKRGRHERQPAAARRVPPAPGAPKPAAPKPPASSPTPPPRSRTEERNEAIRAALSPLGPDERPWPLRIAVIVAVLIGVGNVVQVLVGDRLKFGGTSISGPLLFAVLMLVCAGGMWQQRYWAVLGFQALLAIVILAFSFVLVTADDIGRGAIALLVIGLGGFLFWKLVRVLSRMQMPRPGGMT